MIGATLKARLNARLMRSGQDAGYELDLASQVTALYLTLTNSSSLILNNRLFYRENN